jgi:cytochrome P450
LLVSAPGLTDDLIRDQLLTILIAGHDTSTALLSWALVLLGRHPKVKERASQEVRSVLGDRPPAFEDLSKLEFLDQVINETLRLYPPIHVGMRTAAIDLEFQGYRIPAGSRIMYSIYLTHHSPRYWDEPESFRPDRFAPQNRLDQPPYAFVPFGGGPRNCLGMAFAQVEVKVVLARLLQCFDFVLQPGKISAHMGATLEPRPGVWLTLSRRKPMDGFAFEAAR